MRKKGILLPEVLKIIMGLLGIVILLALAVGLYGIFAKTDVQIANQHMDKIANIVNNLKDGETQTYLLYSPKGWALTAWPLSYTVLDITSDDKTNDISTHVVKGIPNQCISNNWKYCICFCKMQSASYSEDVLSDCNLFGVCRESKIPLVKINFDSSKQENQQIYVSSLVDNKKALFLLNNNNQIFISSQ